MIKRCPFVLLKASSISSCGLPPVELSQPLRRLLCELTDQVRKWILTFVLDDRTHLLANILIALSHMNVTTACTLLSVFLCYLISIYFNSILIQFLFIMLSCKVFFFWTSLQHSDWEPLTKMLTYASDFEFKSQCQHVSPYNKSTKPTQNYYGEAWQSTALYSMVIIR